VELRFVSRGSTPASRCCSVVYPGRRPRRLSHRRLISLQVDVVGRRLSDVDARLLLRRNVASVQFKCGLVKSGQLRGSPRSKAPDGAGVIGE
jgi:hypothetical protein